MFDSLGVTPEEVLTRLGKVPGSSIAECEINDDRTQGATSQNCGKYCIFFAYKRFQRWDESFKQVINDCFSKDTEKNEKKVIKFFESQQIDSNAY